MSDDIPKWLQEYVDSLSETHDVFINGTDVMIVKRQPKKEEESDGRPGPT